MLRRSSSVQTVLVYATFFTLSLMIHMVVVWRPQGQTGPPAEGQAVTEGNELLDSGTPAAGTPAASSSALQSLTQTGAAAAPDSAFKVLK